MLLAWLVAAAPGAASAAPAAIDANGQIVVTARGLPGLDPSQLPAASDTIDAATLRRGGTTSLLRAIDSDLPGVSLDEAQGNPYQPNLLYHGYEASPLGGDPQGLATYVDGARFNQPFGDATNWDLIPDIAVDRLTLEGSNPVFGLNALGGALAVELKTGRSFQGFGGELAAGRFGKRQLGLEGGLRGNGWSAYLAGSIQHDDGWRDFSPSTVRQIYAQIGADGGWGNVDLRLMGATTRLTGNGTAPVELLAARRKSIFTWPDRTQNEFGRALLSADLKLADHLRLRPIAYVQMFHQRTANGDLSDAEACEGDARILCLEGEDDDIVTDSGGAPFPAFNGDEGYAQLNHTRTRTTGYGVAFQIDSDVAVAGMSNRLAIGASWDGSRTEFAAASELGVLTDDRGFGDPAGTIDMADGPIRPVSVVTRRNDLGLYVADVLTLLPALDVTVAARYNRSTVKLSDRLGSALSGRHRYDRLNPSVGISWRVTAGVTLYGGYAEANRAPTPAELSCADEDAPCALTAFFVSDPSLHQVVSRTFEAGIRGKHELGALKLNWRIGGWRATNADDIIFAASETRGRAFFRNVGKTRRQGIESEIRAVVGPWSGRLSYVMTDATYRRGFLLAAPDNPAADDGIIAVRRGDHLPGIPRHRFKATVTRKFGSLAWLSLDAQYSSGRWLLGDEANLTRKTGAYWLANLSGGIKPIPQLEIFAEIRNLTTRKYATFGGFSETEAVEFEEAPGLSNPRSLSPGAPRTWLVGARARF